VSMFDEIVSNIKQNEINAYLDLLRNVK